MGNAQAVNRARKQAQDLSEFDYHSSAELFPSRGKRNSGNIKYRRFSTAAEVLRFAVEELPPPALAGAYLEVDELRFGFLEMQSLYESAAYPLRRRAPTVDPAS
jgi:hypothetical protein